MEHNIFHSALLQVNSWTYTKDILTISLAALAALVSFAAFLLNKKIKQDNDVSKLATKDELKELDKKVCDNLVEFKNDNSKSHAEMRADITMVETRLSKRDDDIKSDFVRLVENIDTKLNILLNKELNKQK